MGQPFFYLEYIYKNRLGIQEKDFKKGKNKSYKF